MKTVDSKTTRYLVDRARPYAQVVVEYSFDPSDGLSQARTTYVYGDDLISRARTVPILVDDGHGGGYYSTATHRRYYHYDGQLSTRYLTDEGDGGATPQVTDEYTYDAFGVMLHKEGLTAAGESENAYLYTGEQYDALSGMYYLRARYYAQQQGRFVTMDPFGGYGSDPMSLHKYLYANANPANLADPTGLFSIVESAVQSAITSTLIAVLQPVIRPAEEYLEGSIAGSLFGAYARQWLRLAKSIVPAVMFGIDFAGGVRLGPLSITAGFSAELLLSLSFGRAVYLAANFVNLSIAGGAKRARVSGSLKAGLVFGAYNAGNYEGPFNTVTCRYKSLPLLIKKLINYIGTQVGGWLKSGFDTIDSEIEATSSWTKLFWRQGVASAESLGIIGGWIASKINSIGDLYVSVFWSPDGRPFGISFHRGVGSTEHFTYTRSRFWRVA